MEILRNSFRIIVGVVFVFSGFVKGIDPLGTVYRMDDYFIVFGLPWAMPVSLFLTILLCTVEFSLGISLLFNLLIRKTAWILLPMMVFFTILTFFDAVYNMVPDCGCFGDALKMTNVQTFLKNVVLIAMVIPIFVWRKQFHSLLPAVADRIILVIIFLAFSSLSIYTYRHLPLIDFMPWKAGNRLNEMNEFPIRFFVTYKNTKTGEEKEFQDSNYPWNDSIWMSEWTFHNQRVEDLNPDIDMVLFIQDSEGNDVTTEIVNNSDYQFIMVAYDLKKANQDAFRNVLPLYKEAESDSISFICLTSSMEEEIKKNIMDIGTGFPFYLVDDVVLKGMVRANPGLILVKDGVVLAKWHYRDIPSYDEIKEKYIKN